MRMMEPVTTEATEDVGDRKGGISFTYDDPSPTPSGLTRTQTSVDSSIYLQELYGIPVSLF